MANPSFCGKCWTLGLGFVLAAFSILHFRRWTSPSRRTRPCHQYTVQVQMLVRQNREQWDVCNPVVFAFFHTIYKGIIHRILRPGVHIADCEFAIADRDCNVTHGFSECWLWWDASCHWSVFNSFHWYCDKIPQLVCVQALTKAVEGKKKPWSSMISQHYRRLLL